MSDAMTLDKSSAAQNRVDSLHVAMRGLPRLELPLTHRFTPGLYVREIFMPKHALVISKIHKTEHPFVILKGRVAVWTEAAGVRHFTGPYVGITQPGTRRVLYVLEDCIWLTFHPHESRDLTVIEGDIIEPHEPADTLGLSAEILNQLKA